MEVFVRNFFLVEVRVGDIETISYIILANLEAADTISGPKGLSLFNTFVEMLVENGLEVCARQLSVRS